MNFKKIALSVVAATLLLVSCNIDNDEPVYKPKGNYDKGIFVVNEGPFENGSGTVTYVSNDLKKSVDGIYKSKNGDDLGNIFQSMLLSGDQAFLVVNNSHKIEVVNRFTFLHKGTIDKNLVNPRYAVVVKGNLYVSNWGDAVNITDDFIAVFDANTLAFKESIPVVLGPEKLQVIGTKIYVAHKGAYGFNNKISVINTTTKTVEKIIEVGDVPNSMGVDSARNLWVLCGGIDSWKDPSINTFGSLHRISSISDEIEKTFKFVDSHPNHLTIDGKNVLYADGTSVYGMGNGAVELPSKSILDGLSVYGLRAAGGFLFVTDAKDYKSKGALTVYKYLTKEKIATLATGISPNGVYFNN